jgi:hypothetical protein
MKLTKKLENLLKIILLYSFIILIVVGLPAKNKIQLYSQTNDSWLFRKEPYLLLRDIPGQTCRNGLELEVSNTGSVDIFGSLKTGATFCIEATTYNLTPASGFFLHQSEKYHST